MAEYTYADVIIDPEDPRVEIGKEYYFGDTPAEALKFANDNGRGAILADADDEDNQGPFWFKDIGFTLSKGRPCIIRKKEPEKKYVPFDLSLEENRARLRGKWIKADGEEAMITGFARDDDGTWHLEHANGYLDPKDAANLWTFLDGTPCGRLIGDSDD